MNNRYETLDDYLDDLDEIKEKITEQVQGMDAKQVKAFFAKAIQNLARKSSEVVQVRRVSGKDPPS